MHLERTGFIFTKEDYPGSWDVVHIKQQDVDGTKRDV